MSTFKFIESLYIIVCRILTKELFPTILKFIFMAYYSFSSSWGKTEYPTQYKNRYTKTMLKVSQIYINNSDYYFHKTEKEVKVCSALP